MGVVRTVVFPALRLVVWALIAVALLWIAFVRTGDRDADAAASPSAVVEPPAAAVTRGDVVNTVGLQGSIQADPATTVKSTAAGQVGRVRAAVGDAVEEGTPLFTVVQTVEPPATTTTPTTTGEAPATAPAAPRTRTVTVTATVAGTLTTLDVLPGQEVTIGGAVATVSPGTLTVSAPLTQAQQYRLLAPPTTARVTVPGGPGTFECTGLRTGNPPAGEGPGSGQSAGGGVDPYTGLPVDPAGGTTGATVTCAVPAGVQVFPGLTATVDVTAGQATGVLLAPVTAVRGTVGTGTVWTVGQDGAQTEVQVELGLTDGQNVEVRDGLTEGQQILQFVPGSDVPTDPNGMYGMGS